MSSEWEKQLDIMNEMLENKGIQTQKVIEEINNLVIELPSWAVGDSGTRYGVFRQSGSARNIWDKIDDCAEINKFIGTSPVMATHALWDRPENGDFVSVKKYAAERGLKIGTVHPNTFMGQEFKFGSICNPDKKIRDQSLAHFIDCVQIARDLGSNVIGMWLADGTNYPGQDHLRDRKHRMFDSMHKLYQALDPHMLLFIEYKLFEPGFYTMDLMDWGMSYLLCSKLGENAKVLVDLGHHAQGVNIEQIVANMIDENKIGGFHLNNRKYADDDLISGSINPLELFLIFDQIVDAYQDQRTEASARNIVYMLDESHNVEPSIEGIMQSILNTQIAYCKALIVDRKSLKQAREKEDVLAANRVLMDAFETDVRPILKSSRAQMGLDPDPITAFRSSGYIEKISKERGISGAGTLGG